MSSDYQPWNSLVPINKDQLPYGPEGVAFPFENDFTWIFVVAIIVAFYAACGIGANDVANSFATSVGAGSLSLISAVIVAGIFEFLGALLLGASVTDTIRGKLIDPEDFAETPDLLMMGMLAALISVAFWLTVATVKEMPVSTTHSVIGGILGFALCLPKVSIEWKEIGKIVGSWFLSPALSACVSSLFFFTIRTFILRKENSFDRVLFAFPIIVWFVVTINVWFIIIKGGKAYKWSEKLGGDGVSLGVAAGIGLGIAVILRLALVPRMRKKLESSLEKPSDLERQENGIQPDTPDELSLQDQNCNGTKPTEDKTEQTERKKTGFSNWAKSRNDRIVEIQDDKIASIHNSAEKFEYRTELAFGNIQIFTACMMAFAHGANDVANAIGPLASIVSIYDTNGNLNSKAPVPEWILVLGGGGIVVGLSAYGYKIIRALGVKLIKVTPSRGSCIELATATVIVIGSILGLPLSTTHTMVGASLGVGLLEGRRDAINLKLLGKIVFGWVLTLIVAGAVSAAVFSLVVYGPSLNRPIAPQNCMGTYGVTYESAENMTIAVNSTVIVGDKVTGQFQVIQ